MKNTYVLNITEAFTNEVKKAGKATNKKKAKAIRITKLLKYIHIAGNGSSNIKPKTFYTVLSK